MYFICACSGNWNSSTIWNNNDREQVNTAERAAYGYTIVSLSVFCLVVG